MKKYIIVFQNYSADSNFADRIKTLGPWARITDNVWCIKSERLTPTGIRDELGASTTSAGKLFVVEITNSSWASKGVPLEVTSWLKD